MKAIKAIAIGLVSAFSLAGSTAQQVIIKEGPHAHHRGVVVAPTPYPGIYRPAPYPAPVIVPRGYSGYRPRPYYYDPRTRLYYYMYNGRPVYYYRGWVPY